MCKKTENVNKNNGGGAYSQLIKKIGGGEKCLSL